MFRKSGLIYHLYHLYLRCLKIGVSIQIHSRRTYFRFIRSLTGLLARLITGERGSKLLEGFWTQKPFTRDISWGRELKGLRRYFQLNRFENDTNKATS